MERPAFGVGSPGWASGLYDIGQIGSFSARVFPLVLRREMRVENTLTRGWLVTAGGDNRSEDATQLYTLHTQASVSSLIRMYRKTAEMVPLGQKGEGR